VVAVAQDLNETMSYKRDAAKRLVDFVNKMAGEGGE
jgi:hypothetical protein